MSHPLIQVFEQQLKIYEQQFQAQKVKKLELEDNSRLASESLQQFLGAVAVAQAAIMTAKKHFEAEPAAAVPVPGELVGEVVKE